MGESGPKIHIAILSQGKATKRTLPAKSKFSVGRSKEADVVLADKDVSRLHIFVTIKDGKFYVEDNGSSNGTLLNNNRIPDKTPTPFTQGDQIRLGGQGPVLQFEVEMPIEDGPKVELKQTADVPIFLPPNLEAEKILNEAKRKAGIILREAEVEADVKAKVILKRAVETEQRAEQRYQTRLQDAHRDAEAVYQKAQEETLAQLSQARTQAHEMREEAEEFAAQMRKDAHAKTADLLAIAEKQAMEIKNKRLAEADNIVKQRVEEEMKEVRHELDKEVKKKRSEVDLEVKTAREELAAEVKTTREKIEKDLADTKEQIEKDLASTKERIEIDLRAAEKNLENLKLETDYGKLKLKELEDSISAIQLKSDDASKVFAEKVKELDEKLAEHQTKFNKQTKELDDQIAAKKLILKGLKESEEQDLLEAKRREESFAPLKDELARLKSETESARLALGAAKNERDLVIKENDAAIKSLKKDLEQEKDRVIKEEETRLNELKLETVKKVQKYEKELLDEVDERRDKVAREVFLAMETLSKNQIDNAQWKKISSSLEKQIKQVIANATGNGEGSVKAKAEVKALSNARRHQIMGAGVGAVLGILIAVGFFQFKLDGSPLNRRVLAAENAQKEDLERRKFNPPQVSEVKNTYVDAVIYTESFAKLYSQNDFQDKFAKAAAEYLFKTWRIEEDHALKAVAISGALVKELAEKKDKIHPDYVNKGIQQMQELERSSNDRLRAELGNDVRLDSYRKFEKKFFLQYRERAPASD